MSYGDERSFKLTNELTGEVSYAGIGRASYLGWELAAVGYEVLDQLQVGETTIDDDGDTWERVE